MLISGDRKYICGNVCRRGLKQWQPCWIILFTVKRTLRAGWYEQWDINFLSLQISTLGRKSEVVRYDYYYDYNYRSFNFFSKNRKIGNR